MPGGSWLGALISGYLSDMLGRKKAIQIGSVIWCIGSIIVCASQNIPMLIVGRIINGFSVGICSAQVPVYITEIAPPSKRGRLVGCQQCKFQVLRNIRQNPNYFRGHYLGYFDHVLHLIWLLLH